MSNNIALLGYIQEDTFDLDLFGSLGYLNPTPGNYHGPRWLISVDRVGFVIDRGNTGKFVLQNNNPKWRFE